MRSISLPVLAASSLVAGSLAAQPPVPPPAPDGASAGAPLRVPAPGIERVTSIFRARRAAEAPKSALGLWLGESDTTGVAIERVTPESPAARAGMLAGERVVAINGTSVRVDRADADDPLLAAVPARRLERTVARLAPGTEVELRVVGRDGRERKVRARTVAPSALADRGGPGGGPMNVEIRRFGPGGGPGESLFRAGPGTTDSAWMELRRRATAMNDSARARVAQRPALGMTLAPSTSPRDTLGLFVSGVVSGGPAERAGVVEGDRVAAINSVDLRTPRDERDDLRAVEARQSRFTRELERLHAGDRVSLRVWGDGRWRTLSATVARTSDVYPAVGRGADVVRFAPGAFGPRSFGPGEFGPDGFQVGPLPPLPPGRLGGEMLRSLPLMRFPAVPRAPIARRRATPI